MNILFHLLHITFFSYGSQDPFGRRITLSPLCISIAVSIQKYYLPEMR